MVRRTPINLSSGATPFFFGCGRRLRFDYQGLESIIPLPGIGCELRLADIYEGVEFGEEKEDMPT